MRIHNIISMGGRCASGSVLDVHAKNHPMPPIILPHRLGYANEPGISTKLWLTGRGVPLRTTPLDLESSRRSWSNGTRPRTTVGVLWDPDSFLFCTGNHCRRHSQLLRKLMDGHPLACFTLLEENLVKYGSHKDSQTFIIIIWTMANLPDRQHWALTSSMLARLQHSIS